MYFTEGQLREYERMMQEKPGFNHEVVKTTVKKDCMHCPVFVSSIIIQYQSMAQTVYPASRRNYTISAQIGSENLQKGIDGQVGIEVVFEFEDGTTETRFIDLF